MKPIISIDFDGVIMKYFLGKTWVDQNKTIIAEKKIPLWQKLHNPWMDIIQTFRQPIPFVKSSIEKLSISYEMHLNTSRSITIKPATINWLRHHDLYSYFSELNFNQRNLQGWRHKADIINKIRPAFHIDDDLITLNQLNKVCGNTCQLIYLSYQNVSEMKPGIIVSRDWNEITKVILAKISL